MLSFALFYYAYWFSHRAVSQVGEQARPNHYIVLIGSPIELFHELMSKLTLTIIVSYWDEIIWFLNILLGLKRSQYN